MPEVTTQVDKDDSLEKLSGERLIAAAQKIWDDSEAAKERARLEREVIEAAKAERLAAKEYDRHLILEYWRRVVLTREARKSAVEALIAFESQQK